MHSKTTWLWLDSKSHNKNTNIYFRIYLETEYDFDPFEDLRKTAGHFLTLNGFKDILAQVPLRRQPEYLRKYLDTNPTKTFLLHNNNRRSWSEQHNYPLVKFVKTKKQCNENKVGDDFLIKLKCNCNKRF